MFRGLHPDGKNTLNNKDLGLTIWETTADHKSNGIPREAKRENTGDHGRHGSARKATGVTRATGETEVVARTAARTPLHKRS